jgi:GNAT superfamily N-acetyltransferase
MKRILTDSIEIVKATARDTMEVFSLVYPLLIELYPHESTYTPENISWATKKLLENHPNYFGFIAYAGAEPAGYIGLNNCESIYAFGIFGEIAELYVKPERRNSRVGAKLVAHAIAFGKNRGWSMLEVGAPSVPAWQKTVDFYQRCGFEVVGPRLYQTI